MSNLTLEEVRRIADSGNYDIVPIATEIEAGSKTPLEVMQVLKTFSHHCFLLESADDKKQWGRYSFLGFDPTLEITCINGNVTLKNNGTNIPVANGDPRPVISQILNENKSARVEGMPTFTGGLVGYFAYDYLKYSEPTLNLDAKDEEGFKDVDLMLFEKVIAFDNERQKIILIANVRTNNIEVEYRRASTELDNIARVIAETKPLLAEPGKLEGALTPLFDKQAYCDMVEAGKNFIREGDIFQVVLSNRLSAPYSGSLVEVYKTLQHTNPSPYMFYFASDDIEMAGASPETLVKLEGETLHTFPLAGTRPRGGSDAEDEALADELLRDEKELAEHNMLVDLGRNDLGKVSEFGSVKLESYKQILKYSHVMHIGSEVRGRLRAQASALDAIDAVLPAGTLSGAPKLRAAEIINELEDNKRGVYGGAIGYLAFTGDMDVCIAIRLAFKKNGRVFVRAGAGIVADSIPEKEYVECINKAKAVVEALEKGSADAPEALEKGSADAPEALEVGAGLVKSAEEEVSQ